MEAKAGQGLANYESRGVKVAFKGGGLAGPARTEPSVIVANEVIGRMAAQAKAQGDFHGAGAGVAPDHVVEAKAEAEELAGNVLTPRLEAAEHPAATIREPSTLIELNDIVDSFLDKDADAPATGDAVSSKCGHFLENNMDMAGEGLDASNKESAGIHGHLAEHALALNNMAASSADDNLDR